MKFNSQYIPRRTDVKVEYPPSQVVPDQSYSIQQLLERFASGAPVDMRVYNEYDDDDDNEDFYVEPRWEEMDLAEVQEEKERLDEVVNRYKEALKAAKKKAAEEAKSESVPAPTVPPVSPDPPAPPPTAS